MTTPRRCSYPDCTEEPLARGLCSRHYQQWRGTETLPAPKRLGGEISKALAERGVSMAALARETGLQDDGIGRIVRRLRYPTLAMLELIADALDWPQLFVLAWMEPIIGVLETFEREFPAVAVHCVVGNHGRLGQKPVFKGRVHDNVEWLFWSVVRDRLKDRGSKVVVNVSPSMDLNVPIYGRNHLLTHGDQFRGGTGISGAFAPLSLGAHRKTKRQMAAGIPMETMVIGHLHQLINIPGVIMGGCMKGYDEYAFALNLPPDPNGAAQAMWITTPERAQTIWMPAYLTERRSEGW